MRLSASKYSAILFLQSVLLLFDMFFNCLTLFPRSHNSFLILFLFQDVFLVLALTVILMNFFSTYLFQAGLVELLFDKFRIFILISVLYLVSCIMLHVYWLIEKWDISRQASPVTLILLFIVQRCLAPWFYHFYKRASLRISDPRYYEDIDWLNRQVQPN